MHLSTLGNWIFAAAWVTLAGSCATSVGDSSSEVTSSPENEAPQPATSSSGLAGLSDLVVIAFSDGADETPTDVTLEVESGGSSCT